MHAWILAAPPPFIMLSALSASVLAIPRLPTPSTDEGNTDTNRKRSDYTHTRRTNSGTPYDRRIRYVYCAYYTADPKLAQRNMSIPQTFATHGPFWHLRVFQKSRALTIIIKARLLQTVVYTMTADTPTWHQSLCPPRNVVVFGYVHPHDAVGRVST